MPTSFDWNQLFIVITFILGYLCIIFEEKISINKATSALLMSVILWVLQFADSTKLEHNSARFSEHLSAVCQVTLFLFGALTIVEIIHAHGGLHLLARLMNIRSKVASLWAVGAISFVLSSILDNLTTTIVMVMMLKKLIKDSNERLLFGSAVVIAANAGGAWTPIGDVTTTMLWVGGQITSFTIMKTLLIPSLCCFAASLYCFSRQIHGEHALDVHAVPVTVAPRGKRVFFMGMLSLMAVPVFKTVTGLPPFMGILFAMSFMWLITDFLHRNHPDREYLRVVSIFPRVDHSGILFFQGILFSIGALEVAGVLKNIAFFLDRVIPSETALVITIGIISSIIDNVPLVAGAMGMYDLQLFPVDSSFWSHLAYCAGTGGSLLVIGSAAGVAFMGLEKVDFFWYIKKATIPAAVGYFAGIIVYYLCV